MVQLCKVQLIQPVEDGDRPWQQDSARLDPITMRQFSWTPGLQRQGFQVVFEILVTLCICLPFCQGLEDIARPLSVSVMSTPIMNSHGSANA